MSLYPSTCCSHQTLYNVLSWRMASSGMIRDVALVRTDVSEGEIFLRSMRRLLVTANVVPSSPILVTLMMEALHSSEVSVLTRSTRRNIPEDAILHSHRRENLKSYNALSYLITNIDMNASIWHDLLALLHGMIFAYRHECIISATPSLQLDHARMFVKAGLGSCAVSRLIFVVASWNMACHEVLKCPLYDIELTVGL
jgi:hypothetical protein